jgi:hypothetical protein
MHFIRTVRPFQDVTKPYVEHVTTNLWEGDPQRVPIRWVPGKRTTGRRMLRECRDCGKTWWEILEQKVEDA